MPTPSLVVHPGTFLTRVFEKFPSHELQNSKCVGAMDSAFLFLACISNLACARTDIYCEFEVRKSRWPYC
jgi:hypothetical protein